ncbi:guanylate kinase [Adlercreutzia murintestinalis]|uniref:guanylate kinase n=1 Tax=Adlercreutzia murintestinalis TaxID=2941325 RepID=UPI00203AEE46|nr:guanylate kinase [Adlercreutzia murintestinalis]
MGRKGNLFVISGPSGAGKGTLVRRLLAEVPDTWASVSATTRAPRAGEVDGREYFFLTREEFEQRIAEGGFLEWAEYDGNLYGTPLASVRQHVDAGEQVILEIEVQGADQVRERMPACKLVFIAPPSLEVLEARLRGRGTNTEASIASRMRTAEVELSRKVGYDLVLVNDDLDVAAAELAAYVNRSAEKD